MSRIDTRHQSTLADRHATASTLMSIVESPGLYADAVLSDEGRNLLFLSLWGRDTAVQEFRARLSLPVCEGGLDGFRLEAGDTIFVQVGNPERLVADSGRTPAQTLFGGLVHLWLYDRLAVAPDRANRRALLLYRTEEDATADGQASLGHRLWSLVTETCHLPLLPAWRDTVLDAFHTSGWIKRLDGIGLAAYALDLGSAEVETVVTRLIRERRLIATEEIRHDPR